ncbi:MAG: DUF853 family protein [Clostridiales bacterium]|nr:DUF853 family protein [Clostridiales bacterium]
MKTVIMAWAKEGFREFFLPGIHNADYQIRLGKKVFQLQEDLELKLEILDGKWRIQTDEAYSFRNEWEPGDCVLKDGSLFTLIPAHGRGKLSLMIVQWENAGLACRKFDISGLEHFSVGSSGDNQICYTFQNYISRIHTVFTKRGGVWTATDKSGNGTFVDGCRIQGSRELRFGDCVNLFGLKLIFLGDVMACSVVGGAVRCGIIPEYDAGPYEELPAQTERKENKKYYKSAPRTIEPLFEDVIEVEGPPPKKQVRQKPVFMTIGPSFTMVIPMLLGTSMAIFASRAGGGGSAFMYTGLITAAGSAVFGTMWALTNLRYAQEEARSDEELRYNAYGSYIIGMTGRVRQACEDNRRALFFNHPSGEECCALSDADGSLWNRNRAQDDFLTVRLGLGDMPFQGNIEIPRQRFQLLQDELMEKPGLLKDSFKMLYQVPICLDLLRYPMVGVIGGAGKKEGCRVLQNIAAQLAAHNSYTDVKMVFIYDGNAGDTDESWEFAKWLPHVWSEDQGTRYIARTKADVGDISYTLGNVLRGRAEEQDTLSHTRSILRPWYVLFLIDPQMLEGELISRYVTNPKQEYGITVFWLGERYENLPNSCEEIIQKDGFGSGLFNVYEGRERFVKICLETVGDAMLKSLSRRLCTLRVSDEEKGGDIPNRLGFFEMYRAAGLEELRVLQRWKKNKVYESMRVLVGQKSGGQDCYLDIHEKYHGPHGLVAGTTGSGKSETLQTYILSLAVNFSPDDVCFFIIDFKGGGMANLFTDLPHLAGQISNLSGNQVRRAMVSIKSENRRRQKLFNDNSVNNINSYTRLYKNGEASVPVPHLLIIIDEFAELRRAEPEFMKELISVAQVGRSLGVHLILSTQKPDGTVDENIWSNTKFRLCLRVQDKKDSMGMLHRPEAAYITQAGRGYLQVGNDEIFEQFQSGYSGAVYENGQDVTGTIAEMLTITGRKAMAGSRAKRENRERQKRAWYAALIGILTEEAEASGLEPKQLAELLGEEEQQLAAVFSKIARMGYAYEQNSQNVTRLKTFAKYMQAGMDSLVLLSEKAGMKFPECPEVSQLDAVIEYVAKMASENHYSNPQRLWMPVLPEQFYVEVPKEYAGYGRIFELKAPVGLYDDPANQNQGILELDFAQNGHHAVCGGVASGKSTFLQTAVFSLLHRYSPEQLQFYLLDFGSRMLACLAEAPHVGGLVCDGEEDKLRIFISMLERMMDERRGVLKGGNFSQYIRAHGPVLPAVVIVIDNYAGFREKTQDVYMASIMRLAKEGVGCGIFLLISAAGFGIADIPGKLADNIQTVIALEMGDKFKYGEVFRVTRTEVLPEAGVKGRGLAFAEGELLEFQTALAVKAEDDFERGRLIGEISRRLEQEWKGSRAAKIPEIPAEPDYAGFMQETGVKKYLSESRYLPIGYRKEDASVYAIDFRDTYTYLISGKNDSGKMNVLKLILLLGAAKGAELVAMEKESRELRELTEKYEGTYVSTHEELFGYFKGLLPEFRRRNQLKRQYLAQGMDEDAVFERMQEEKPIFIFIADLLDWMEDVYKPLPDGSGMQGFLENIMEKGKCHNIYFFGCVRPEDEAGMLGRKVFRCFADYGTGIHLGGNLALQRVFSFSNISYMQQNKASKPGSGLVPSAGDSSTAETVILPLVRRSDL